MPIDEPRSESSPDKSTSYEVEGKTSWSRFNPSTPRQPAGNLHSQIIFRNRERDTRREQWQYRRDLEMQQRREERRQRIRNGRYNRDYRYNYDDRYHRDGRYNRDGRYHRNNY